MIGADASEAAVLEQVDVRDCFASVYLASVSQSKPDAGMAHGRLCCPSSACSVARHFFPNEFSY
jgi:hypothetical protein